MPPGTPMQLPTIVRSNQPAILSEWVSLQRQSSASRGDLVGEVELERQSREFLGAFVQALDAGALGDVNNTAWEPARDIIRRIVPRRAQLGFTASETATFVFSLKQPLLARLRDQLKDRDALSAESWAIDTAIDSLGLLATEMHQKSRDEIISRQQQEMMELSTPVVTLWEGILALPLIGTLDSARTQVVMENLLQRIVDTGSMIAILDITGVPTVDTLVAQHLLKTVAAARLMGADCIISGIRPQIAQTIVHLGVDLNSVTTKATLADAFAVALKRLGLGISKTGLSPTKAFGVAAPPEA
jgi:rsbT co-antagonist protein RsbR